MFRNIALTLVTTVLLSAALIAQRAPAAKTAAVTKPAAQIPATAASDSAQLPSEETVSSFMKHMFGWDPNVSFQIVEIKPSKSAGVARVFVILKTPQGQQKGEFYVLPDRKFAILGGDLIPFGADPFAPARAELAARADGPARGPAKAAVTIVEFSDLECPACKAAQPTVDRLIADEPDVRFIFQNFPLDMHPWSHLAAAYADCVARQNNEAFWTFIGSVYRDQDAITALLPSSAANAEDAMKQATPAITKKLQELVAATPADSNKVAACAAAPGTADRIKKSLQLGDDLGVTGTPALFVNGRNIGNVGGIPYETLKLIVDNAKTEGSR